MTYSGISYAFGLVASGATSAVHSRMSGSIGTPTAVYAYPVAPDIIYQLALQIASGDTLTLDFETGIVTGTVAGAYQVETATVVAAGGCTSNGNCDVVVTGAHLTGSPITIPVALTTVTHTTATLIATAIKTALIANAVIAAQYTPNSSGAAVTLTDLTKRANDATLNIAIPAGLGISAAASSANTTAGVAVSMAYKRSGTVWDATDAEGVPLAVATKLYSVLMTCSAASGALNAEVAGEIKQYFAPFASLETTTTGAHSWGVVQVEFTAFAADLTVYLDIHAGT